MANIKKGDTWPPLRGAAADQTDLLPLAEAELIEFFAKQTVAPFTLISGTATVIDPPDSDGFNWQYTWSATDTAVTGTYITELQITWDTSTTPDRIETVPNNANQNPTLTVWEDQD